MDETATPVATKPARPSLAQTVARVRGDRSRLVPPAGDKGVAVAAFSSSI